MEGDGDNWQIETGHTKVGIETYRMREPKQAACKHLQAACFDDLRLIGLIAPKSPYRAGRVRSSTSWQSHTRARRL